MKKNHVKALVIFSTVALSAGYHYTSGLGLADEIEEGIMENILDTAENIQSEQQQGLFSVFNHVTYDYNKNGYQGTCDISQTTYYVGPLKMKMQKSFSCPIKP